MLKCVISKELFLAPNGNGNGDGNGDVFANDGDERDNRASNRKDEYTLAMALKFITRSFAEKYNFDPHSYDIINSIFNNLFRFADYLTLAIEEKYVDSVYRDSYYLHYASKHYEYSRYCSRIFIFIGKIECSFLDKACYEENNINYLQNLFAGLIVFRPTNAGSIVKCLIKPDYMLAHDNNASQGNCYTRKRKHYLCHWRYEQIFFKGYLRFNAFPFMMQDTETITCAEATILNLMDYFGHKNPDFHTVVPSDISKIVASIGIERTLPSKGLSYELLSRVLMEFGFQPRMHAKIVSSKYEENISQKIRIKRILHHHVESAIPVAVSVKYDGDIRNHSIVCIGHANNRNRPIEFKFNEKYDNYYLDTADIYNEYICMDDNKCPYSLFSINHTKESEQYDIRSLVVPLYKEVNLDSEDAFDICKNAVVARKIPKEMPNKETVQTEKVIDMLKQWYLDRHGKDICSTDNPLLFRLFLARSNEFFKYRIEKSFINNDALQQAYSTTEFPKYVWVTEIYDIDGLVGEESQDKNEQEKFEPYAIGEIILDATAVKMPSSVTMPYIIINLPTLFQKFNRKGAVEEQSIDNYDDEIKNSNTERKYLYKQEGWQPFCGYTKNLVEVADMDD